MQKLCLTLVVVACVTLFSHAQTDDHQKTLDGLAKLAPLVGKWHAVAQFHDHGKTTERVGTYTVSYALDGQYLKWDVEFHHPDDPTKHQLWTIYTTFNPATNQYNQTFFYSNWNQRVTDTGEFDDSTREYRTSALVPLEDGVHDESVRTVTSLKDPARIVHRHYSRYGNEDAERMNVEITLTREP